jgi:uncharacterized membrane protein HdeD (DUF308 family)
VLGVLSIAASKKTVWQPVLGARSVFLLLGFLKVDYGWKGLPSSC